MPDHKKKPASMAECIGPSCQGCSSGNCYAAGGVVGQRDERKGFPSSKKGPEGYSKYQEQAQNQKGVHTPRSGVTNFPGGQGTSRAGDLTKDRYAGKPTFESGSDHPAKEEHRRVLGEMKSQPKPNLYAEGGSVGSWTKREDNEKGVHRPFVRGVSMMGMHNRAALGEEDAEDKESSVGAAKIEARRNLKNTKAMPKPNLYAEGGEVSEGEDQFGDDHEIHGMLGDELMGAFEAKDKKRIMESLEAIVLSCMNKEHHDDV
jgi:hypothetical protein